MGLRRAYNPARLFAAFLLRRFTYFLPREICFAAAGAGCVLFRYHCCPIPTKLLVRIYNASPLENGKIMKLPANMIGMIFIICCCCGSPAVIGVIFETRYIETPTTTGKT